MTSPISEQRAGPVIKPQKYGVAIHDADYEKDSYENDPARAPEPGADAPFTEKDTAALTSDDQASQPSDWQNAAPHEDDPSGISTLDQ